MADDKSRSSDRHHDEPAAEEGDVKKPPSSRARAGAEALEAVALPVSMVMVQLFTLVMLLLSKLALNTGMRPFVLLVYRNLVATAAIAPLAFIFEWEMWKKLKLDVLGWISLNATFGVVLATGLYYYGLRATNPAYSVIFLNLIPVVTFVIAVVVRAERVALGKWPGRMKLLGALTCVGGTMIVSLLKGRLLHLWPTHLLNYSHGDTPAATGGHHHDMVAGTLFLCGSCLSYALWFIIQARLGKIFPSRYWATMLTCLSGTIQSFVVGIFLSHHIADWRLKCDLQLLTIVYSGLFNTGITFVLISWAVTRRGPIYPSMFNSLSLIIATVMDSVLLGTNIYAASIVGTLLVVVGLYAYLWGKGKELQAMAVAKKLEQAEEQAKRDVDEMT
nr:unnamed protein product [Digitaria exilis]